MYLFNSKPDTVNADLLTKLPKAHAARLGKWIAEKLATTLKDIDDMDIVVDEVTEYNHSHKHVYRLRFVFNTHKWEEKQGSFEVNLQAIYDLKMGAVFTESSSVSSAKS